MLPVPVAVNDNALFSAAALQRTLPELLETAKHVPPSNPLYRALLGTAFQEAMDAQYFRKLANRQTLDPARLTTDEERDADDAAKAGELERRIQAAQSAAVAASERGADSSAALYAGLRAGVAVVVAPRYVGPVVVVGDSMAAREFQKVFDEDARKRRAQVELEAEGADGEEDKASKAKKPRKRAPKDKDAAKAEKLPRKDTRKRPGRKRPPRPSSGAGQLRAEDPITDPRVRVADAQRPSTEAIETYGVTPDGGLAAWRVNAYWAAPRAADRVRAMETAAAQLHEQLRSRLQQLAPCAPATAESTPSDELSMDAWCRALPGGYATVREKRAALEQAVDEAPIAPSTAPGPAEVARARQEGVFPRGHPCAGLPDALLMTPAELAALDAPAYVESIVARFDACYLDLNASTARTHPAHESRSITNNFARCRASLVAHDLHGFVASSPNMGAWRMETPLHECLPAECEVQSGGDASASAPAGPKEPVPARLYAHASAGDLAMALRHPEVLACLSHPLCRPQEQLGEWPVLFALDALGSLAVNPPQRGELVAERHYWRARATTAPLLAALVAHLSCTPLPTLDKLGEAGAWWLGVGAPLETPTERAVRLHLAHTFVARRAAVALSLRLRPRHWVELKRDNAAVQFWGGYISLWLELRLVRLPCMHALAAAWAAYMFDPSMAMYDYAPMSVTYNPPDLTSPEQYALEKARELSRVYHKGEAGRLRALLSSYASTALHRATSDGLDPALEAERRAHLLRNAAAAAAAATAEGAAAGELPPAARVVYTSATYDPVSAVWATFQRQACDTLRVPLEPKRIDVRTFAATVWDHRHNTSTLVGDARAPTAETVTLTSYARSYALMRRWNTAKGLPIQFTSMPFRCVANSVTEACVSGAQPAWPPLATYAALALEYAQRLERGLASFAGREISAGEMRGLLSHVERGEEERTRWLVMERNASPYLLYIQTRARYCDGDRGQQKKRRAGDADADEQQEEKDGENQNRSLTADKFAGAAYARPSLTWASRVGVARLLRRWRIVQRASPEGSLPSAVLMSEACTRVANELYDEIAETTYSSMRGYAREMLVKRISADAYRMPAHKGLRRAMCLPVEPVRGADGTTAEEQAEEYEDTDDRWQLVD